MAFTARASNYRFMFGKQTVEGTAQATPSYEVTIAEGGSIKPNLSENEAPAIDTEELPSGFYADRADSMGNPTIFCDNEVANELWALFLGADAVTGTTPNYSHTTTRAITKPFTTFHQMRPAVGAGAGTWEQMVDGIIRKIEMTASNGQPLRVALDLIGKSHVFNTTLPTPTNDRRWKATNTQLLTMIGAVLKFDLGATPATTLHHEIDQVVLTAEYTGSQYLQTDALNPTYLDLGELRLGLSFDMVFQDLTAYASTFFGSTTLSASMAQSAVLVTGSADVLFNIIPTVNANRSLEVQLPSLRYRVTPPEPVAAGSAVKVTVTAQAQAPASGEPITVLGKNGAATLPL